MRVIGFSLKCWLTSVVLGSFSICMYVIYLQIIDRPDRFASNLLEIVGLFLFYSFLFLVYSFMLSIPGLIAFCVLNSTFNRSAKSESQFRITASVVASILWFVLIFLAFKFVFSGGFRDNAQMFLVTLPYLLGLLFGIWYYKVNFSLSQEQSNAEDILDSPL